MQTLVKIIHITIDFVISPASDRIILGLGPQICITWIWTRPTGVWMVSLDHDDAFWGQHLLKLGTRSGYPTVVSRVPCASVLCCLARLEGGDCSKIDSFSFNISREVFLGFLNRFIQPMRHIHCKISPRSAPEWSWILVKSSHITIDFVTSPASERIIWGLGPQLCITWISMRPIVVWMVSVDQDHAFRGQQLLKLGTRSGYSTVVSKVPCARVLCCAARLEE